MSDEHLYTLEILENRDYATWLHSDFEGRLEHAIRRDRIAYYLLQMDEFQGRPPYDLPPWHDGRRYTLWMLHYIDMRTPELHALHELLTSLEADVVAAAQSRGFRLKRRPCDIESSGDGRRGNARKRGAGGGLER